MERKEFLKLTLGLCGVTLVPAAIIESCTKQTYAPTNVNFTLDLTATANAALNNPGGSVTQSGVIVIRTGSNTFTALSTVCTHQGCTLNYAPAISEMTCPCHGGAYDLNGNVVAGPPPSALTKYTTSLSGHILTVKS